MDIKLPKYLANNARIIIKNNEQNRKLGKQITEWLDRYDYGLDNDIEDAMSIVKGEVIEKDNKKYLYVEGFEPAGTNGDGVYCRQICHGEDWYSGELYFYIDSDTYLQVHFSC